MQLAEKIHLELNQRGAKLGHAYIFFIRAVLDDEISETKQRMDELLKVINKTKPRHPNHPESEYKDSPIGSREYNKAYKKWNKLNKLIKNCK